MASVSFTAWTISQLPALRAILFPVEDLHVVSLNSLHGGIVVNQGDKEVFLSHIMLKMNRRAPWGAQRFPINESLPPGKFVKVPVPRSDDFGEGGWVRGIQPSVLEKFIDVAIDDTRCFHIVFFSADDPLFRELKGFAGPSLLTRLLLQDILSTDQFMPMRSVALRSSPALS